MANVGNGRRITVACALRILYHKTLKVDWSIEHIPLAKVEKKLPVVLSPAEVEHFLAAVISLNTDFRGRTPETDRSRSAPTVWVRTRSRCGVGMVEQLARPGILL